MLNYMFGLLFESNKHTMSTLLRQFLLVWREKVRQLQ